MKYFVDCAQIDPLQNGSDFNILLSAFKLALLASFVVRYSFESLTQERSWQG